MIPTSSSKLFHVLVVIGAAAVGSAAGCERDAKPVDPDTAAREPKPAPVEAPASGPVAAPDRVASSSGDAEAAAACACVGEGTQCKANGVMCCWATDPCCPSCCG